MVAFHSFNRASRVTIPIRFGRGLGQGPYVAIQGDQVEIDLSQTGVDAAVIATGIPDMESPNIVDVRLQDGGVSSDYGLTLLGTRYAGAGDKTIIGIQEFQRKNTNTVLVRMRPTGWDRWNGVAWLTLAGALSGVATDRTSMAILQDKLVVANKVDKLKYWTGVDGDAVADLSADSPISYFVAPIGQRLVAARINSGAGFDPYFVKWSADGNIQDWTNANNGAGSAILEPEGKSGATELINGLTSLETQLVIYRQRSIMTGTRTGIGSLPFRFSTVLVGIGTDSPYSIATVGAAIGDIFLASDYSVYLFNGRDRPIPIGFPIHNYLKTQVTSIELAYGLVDRRRLEYWLMICTGGSTLPNVAWVFDIKAYLTTQRLVWRKKTLVAGYAVGGFGSTSAQSNPFVDTVLSIVNTVGQRVDEFANPSLPTTVLLGDGNGGVTYVDESTFIVGGFETKQYNYPGHETMLDKVFLEYTAPTQSVVEISVSSDGGQNYGFAKQVTLPVSGYANRKGTWLALTVPQWQLKLRILSGNVTIGKIYVNRAPRGAVSIGS